VESEWPNLEGWCQVIGYFGTSSGPFPLGCFRLLGQHGDAIARTTAQTLVD
jgi:hypothetical protein